MAAIKMSGYRVIVTKHRTADWSTATAAPTSARPQSEQEAQTRIALLAGVTVAPAGGRPWRQPVAGGQRIIELERQW